MIKSNRHSKAQALVEFAVIAPVLLLFVLLTIDVGRAFFQAVDAAGAARAGARMAIISDTSDLGDALRSEPNSGIPNTVGSWGQTGPGQIYGTCTTGTTICGDPNGCAPNSFAPNQLACFAIRSCTMSSGTDLGTCTLYGSWGYRPEPSTGHALEIVVVIKFLPTTPALSNIVGNGGVIYITQTAYANELYF